MSAATFSLDPSLRDLNAAALLKKYNALSPEDRRRLGFTRLATDQEAANAPQPASGAPFDFGGPVLPNPNGITVSADTDPGGEVTRLPNGVSFQKDNWRGALPSDISNPPRTQIVTPVAAQSGGVDYDALAKESGAISSRPAGDIDYDSLAKQSGAISSRPPVQPLTQNKKDYASPVDAANEIAEMLGGAVKSLAKTSGPNILYEVLRKNFPNLGLKSVLGMPTANEVGANAVTMLIPGAEGEGAAEGAVPKAEAPVSSAASKAGSVLEHPGVKPWVGAMKRELMKIPGMDLAKTTFESAKGFAEGTEPPAPPTPPVPTTDGVPWGTKIPAQGPPELWGKQIPVSPAPSAPVAPEVKPKTLADLDSSAPAPKVSTGSGAGVPRTLSGDSALRQILTGQDNANLLKIAKSRGINVAQESQLKPGIADSKLINKIIDDFSDDELDGVRSQFIENTRMGKHQFGDIGPEAWKTMSLQSYFPDVKIPQAVLKRTQGVIADSDPVLSQKLLNLKDFMGQEPPKVAAKTAKTAAVKAPASDDLTSVLQQSVDQAGKGVFTSAEPKALLDRWGVDPESFTEGRSQTRGMSSGESDAAIQKLVEAYKKGEAIEPVIETRDSGNNIVDVDGRGRALAAHKAGVKRIPIIVRRMQ